MGRFSGFSAPFLILSSGDHALAGGVDAEAVSGSETAVSAIAAALRRSGARVYTARAQDVDSLLGAVRAHRPALVFNLIESFLGHDHHEASACTVLELLGIPYTGSPPYVLSLCQRKHLTKGVLSASAIPTPRGTLIRKGQENVQALTGLAPPLFVKPCATDASHGIDQESIAHRPEDALARARYLRKRYDTDALVEEYIEGRELNVAVRIGPEGARCLPISEITFRSDLGVAPIVTYASKWREGTPDWDNTPVRCPAVLDPELQERVEAIALAAVSALECRDYARVDLRIRRQGNLPFVLEINPNPDLSPGAGFSNAAAAAGLSYDALIEGIVVDALTRSNAEIVVHSAPRSLEAQVSELVAADREPIASILAQLQTQTEIFSREEVITAIEMIDETLHSPGGDDPYQFLVAKDPRGHVLGYACFGSTPLTRGAFDLYWIAVDPALRGGGIGRLLLAAVEERVATQGGRILVAETSSRTIYEPTRMFYERSGYIAEARLEDFYATGDAKVLYTKRIAGRAESNSEA